MGPPFLFAQRILRVAVFPSSFALPIWARASLSEREAPSGEGAPFDRPFDLAQDRLRANGLIPVMLSLSKHDRTRNLRLQIPQILVHEGHGHGPFPDSRSHALH
jgi:hypothetical protein